MTSVRIVADSGCDLPPEIVEEYDITIVPVMVRFDQEVIPSDQITHEEFWSRVQNSDSAPATSSPPPHSFQRAFQRLTDAGHDVICMTLPGQHSGTFNAAWLAAQEFGEKVRVVDSGSFSLGMGLQVLAAAKEALRGQGADSIQAMLAGLRSRTAILFALDTMEWVRQGGRLDRLMPLIDRVARTFHVKPVLEMVDGEFRLLGIARSTHSALTRIEQEVRSRLPVEALAAAYTRGRGAATELVALLASCANIAPGQVLVTEAGPAFAAHAGPNALGAIIIRR